MNIIYMVVVIIWFVGIIVYVGGLLVCYECIFEIEIKDKVIYGVVVFGGGMLIFVVVYVLLLFGIENFLVLNLSLIFLVGSVVFCFLD